MRLCNERIGSRDSINMSVESGHALDANTAQPPEGADGLVHWIKHC